MAAPVGVVRSPGRPSSKTGKPSSSSAVAGGGTGSSGGAHAARADGHGRDRPRAGPQRLDEEGGGHDVDDGVPGADLVEGDVFRRHAVDAPLGLGEDGEDRDGAPRHRGIERGAQQHRADVAEGAVVRVALGRRDEEAPSREDAVVEALGRGHDARRKV